MQAQYRARARIRAIPDKPDCRHAAVTLPGAILVRSPQPSENGVHADRNGGRVFGTTALLGSIERSAQNYAELVEFLPDWTGKRRALSGMRRWAACSQSVADVAMLNYHDSGSNVSFDAVLDGVPERGSIAVFGTATVGCAALFIRQYTSSGFNKCPMIRNRLKPN